MSDNLSDIKDWVNEEGAKGMRFFPKGGILLPKSGASVFLNHRVMLGVDSYVSGHLAVVIADSDKAVPKFVLCSLCEVDAKTLTSDQSYPSLRLSRINDIEIRLPSLAEQRRIAAAVDSEWRMVESCRALAESHAEKVRERMGEVWGD